MRPSKDQLYPAKSARTGWGRKNSGKRAVQSATARQEDYRLFEDGFLRSVGREDVALSVVSDDLGIYYDATSASRLEKLITKKLDSEQTLRAQAIHQAWRNARVSKYNVSREYEGPLPDPYVLLIDQVAGDLSIQYGLANAASFDRMLQAALDENPDKTIVVKMHPDIYTRKKTGHFNIHALEKMERVQVIAETCHPVRLIEHAEAVYTVTSQMGFEALIWGKRVRCFGMPFYAGWGLTEDELPAPERRGSASLEQLVYAALVEYPRYIDPERNKCCEVETVMEHIGLQRQMRARFPAVVYASGFSRWKKPILRRFLQGSNVRFVQHTDEVPVDGTLMLWGNSLPDGLPQGVKIIRLEDGFLRSSGLGADLIRPLSWVIDDLGLYYDPATPSRLETILQTHLFDATEVHRAQGLREKIVSLGISKYNLGDAGWHRPQTNQTVILVPGQVENDASIRYGTEPGASNLGLLKAVRKHNPQAYIVYKPHPDVVAGLRKPGNGEQDAEKWCNETVTEGDTTQMLEQVDEVHTLTSLAGFEALLRGVPVTCHGRPFYAGWGLTTDFLATERRTRKLRLEELVVGTLMLYPTYVSRTSNTFTTPERAVGELAQWRTSGVARMPLPRRMLRSILRAWVALGLKRNA